MRKNKILTPREVTENHINGWVDKFVLEFNNALQNEQKTVTITDFSYIKAFEDWSIKVVILEEVMNSGWVITSKLEHGELTFEFEEQI